MILNKLSTIHKSLISLTVISLLTGGALLIKNRLENEPEQTVEMAPPETPTGKEPIEMDVQKEIISEENIPADISNEPSKTEAAADTENSPTVAPPTTEAQSTPTAPVETKPEVKAAPAPTPEPKAKTEKKSDRKTKTS